MADPQSTPSLTLEQAIANLQGTDPGDRYYAAWWLGRFRVKTETAITALITALEDDTDREPDGSYPLKRNAARALGKLQDQRAVTPLMTALDCTDYYVREAAAQSLGKLGDPVCIPLLMNLLTGGLEAAQPIPGVPHLAQPYEAVLEALGQLQAHAALPLIEPFLTHPVELVEYAAHRALYQLTQKPQYGDRLVEALKGDRLQLRRAALADVGAIGYLPAAEVIAETLAENSLKLIALKGVLEHHVTAHATELPTGLSAHGVKENLGLAPEAQRIMALMDGLL